MKLDIAASTSARLDAPSIESTVATAAPSTYWDELYANWRIAYRPDRLLFKDLFDRHLPRGGRCFEIGCYPGNYLVYLAQRFGYRVSGIDTTPFVLDRLPAHLRHHGVAYDRLIRGDFFSGEIPGRYDVVTSYGFVEHFVDFRAMLRRQAAMVADGGVMVVSCPNFRGLQQVLHRFLDAPNLRRHVLAAMDLDAWRRTLRQCGLRILHADYYQTADFWVDSPVRDPLHRALVRWVKRACGAMQRHVDLPNAWTSPYLVCFAQRA